MTIPSKLEYSKLILLGILNKSFPLCHESTQIIYKNRGGKEALLELALKSLLREGKLDTHNIGKEVGYQLKGEDNAGRK